VSKTELMNELEIIRRQGYAFIDQQYHLTARGLGAPIFDSTGVVRAAVSVAGYRTLPIWDDMQKLIELVRAAGRRLSRRLT
jgi:DNA-binding IclR family transcriptional regulator